MEIRPPNQFNHAGQLPAFQANADPRSENSGLTALAVDLRECTWVRPAAVLWCAIYPLLAARNKIPTDVLVPENLGTAIYLKRTGLFDVLKAGGVRVDDRGLGSTPEAKIVMPMTQFGTEADVQRLANRAYENLVDRHLGSAVAQRFATESFGELATNAVQHAESPVGAFGFIQFYEFEEDERFVIGVADGGIGIRRSLEKNPELQGRIRYDWTAIEEAIRERISRTGNPHRGIGLYGISEDMKTPGRQLIIHSGQGMLMMNDGHQSAQRTALFPGTLAYAAIVTKGA